MGQDLLLGYQKRETQSDVAAFSRQTAFLPTATESLKVSDDRHYETPIFYRTAPVDDSIELELDGQYPKYE